MSDPRAQIMQGDDVYFTEMLRDVKEGVADLMIETAGGFTDPTEKIASILRDATKNLRVIVPCRAKSNGTMLALVGSQILMGTCSELGPAETISVPSGPCSMIRQPRQFLRALL
jgi:membrane-bound ClpP family serine protease